MSKTRAISAERRAQIGAEKRARTRAAILEATFQVIGKENGRLARIEQVCEAAQIARPTFYTYFSSLEELFEALSYEMSHEFNTAVLAYCALQDDPAKEGSAGIRYYLRKAAKDHRWGWGMVNLSFGGPIFGAETYDAVTNTVRRGIESGSFRVHDVNVGRDMVLGTAMAAMTTLLGGTASDDYPEIVARQILVGLGVHAQRAYRITTQELPDPMSVLGASPPATGAEQATSARRGLSEAA